MMHTERLNTTRFTDFDDHEVVVRCRDDKTGLDAIIAIHNRNLGPALGGCRMRAYESTDAAITDALRLSRGMTYKSALAGLPLGGGKAVINASTAAKTPALLAAMGRFVDSLRGAYIVAEDSGTCVADIVAMGQETRFVAGTRDKQLTDGTVVDGDPSRSTAYGVFRGIGAAADFRFRTSDLSGVHVALQGAGQVGFYLGQLLHRAGATLTVADIDPGRTRRMVDHFGVRVVAVDEIHRTDCDVFAPCALGGVLTASRVSEIAAPVIAGAANNQLADPAVGDLIHSRGLLYAPDYVINAGGIIDIHYERTGYDHRRVMQHVDTIGKTLGDIFAASHAASAPTNAIADQMARKRFQRARTDVA